MLQSIGGSLSISHMVALASLSGLGGGLASLGASLVLDNNDALDDLTGLDGLHVIPGAYLHTYFDSGTG